MDSAPLIIATPEPLTIKQQAELKAFLSKGEFQILQRVIEAKAKTCGVAMLSEAVISKDFENKIHASNDNLRKTQRYVTCLEVLKEIKDQTDPYTAVKLT